MIGKFELLLNMQAARISAFPIEFNENATLGIQGTDNQEIATANISWLRFCGLKPVETAASNQKPACKWSAAEDESVRWGGGGEHHGQTDFVIARGHGDHFG